MFKLLCAGGPTLILCDDPLPLLTSSKCFQENAIEAAFHLLCDCETSIFAKVRLKLQTRCPLVYGSCAWWGGEHNISKCLAYYNYNSQPSSFVTLHGFYSVHAWNLEIEGLQHGELKIKLELEGNNISSHVISAKYDNFSASHSGGSWKCLLQCYWRSTI